eukprot:5591468-Amphidinium_carterae.1
MSMCLMPVHRRCIMCAMQSKESMVLLSMRVLWQVGWFLHWSALLNMLVHRTRSVLSLKANKCNYGRLALAVPYETLNA